MTEERVITGTKNKAKQIVALLLVVVIVCLSICGVVYGCLIYKYGSEIAVCTVFSEAGISVEQIDLLLDCGLMLTEIANREEKSISQEESSLIFDVVELFADIGYEVQAETLYAYGHPKDSKKDIFATVGYADNLDKAKLLVEKIQQLFPGFDFDQDYANFKMDKKKLLASTRFVTTICNNVVQMGQESFFEAIDVVCKMLASADIMEEVPIKAIQRTFDYASNVTNGIDVQDLYLLDVVFDADFRNNIAPGCNELLKVLHAIDRNRFWDLISNLPDGIAFVLAIVNFAFIEQGVVVEDVARGIHSIINELCLRNGRPKLEFEYDHFTQLFNTLIKLSQEKESKEQRQAVEDIINEISNILDVVFIE